MNTRTPNRWVHDYDIVDEEKRERRERERKLEERRDARRVRANDRDRAYSAR